MRRVKRARRLIAVTIPVALYVAAPWMPNAAFTTFRFHTPFSVDYDSVFWAIQYFFRYGRRDLDTVCYASAWMANPALWCAILFIAVGWRRMAMICAGVACLLALGLFVNSGWVSLFPAYWFWSASMTSALLCAGFLLKPRTLPYAEDYGYLPPKSG
jgi:hypothetical protein